MKAHHIKTCILLTTIFISSKIIACNNLVPNAYSLNRALEYYGFTHLEQRKALKTLFQQAAIIPCSSSSDSIFPPRETANQLAIDILTILKGTQEKFTIRRGTQERWEVQPLTWMTQDEENIRTNLEKLGFVNAIIPTITRFDAICILGATTKRMADRIAYADSLLTPGLQPKAIILLSGERYVTKEVDGTEAELSKIAQKFNLNDWRDLTETHIIRHLYNSSTLYNRGITTYTIDTAAQHLPRPTTQSTIIEFISWLKNHSEIKSVIFVSNQPYIKYQEALISAIFKEKEVAIPFEVVGSAVAQSHNVQPLLEGLGSYLWAASPTVLSKMRVSISDPLLKASFRELYSNNPLIYNVLPQSFRQ